MGKLVKGPVSRTSTVEKVVAGKVVPRESAPPEKSKAAGDPFDGFREEGSAPQWSDVHGLTNPEIGFDALVLTAAGLRADIEELTAQYDGVRAELMMVMKGVARNVKVDDLVGVAGARVEYNEPEKYLGTPKREKLVQLGVPEKTIDKACDWVNPKPHVKIVIPGKKKE